MPAHQRVQTWIAHNYQKPAIDQASEWLADCSDWLSSELGLNPDRDFDEFIRHVEAQLLQSNLADSTVPGSGIDPLLVANPNPAVRPRPSSVPRPARRAPRRKMTTGSTPLLVEIRSITEIAHSAFTLLNTHQTRLDRADLGLASEENVEQHHDEDEGPIPRFPRGMLRFELSDGSTTFRAIEFRSISQLELGTTPLGYKIFLESAPIRNGIAFLEPANVVLKGYRTEDHDINSEQVFLSSLRKRLGRPDPTPEASVASQPRINLPARPAPAQPARQHEPFSIVQRQSPPSDFDDMYVDDDVDPDVLREVAIQMDKAIDKQPNQRVGIRDRQPARSPSTSKEKPPASSIPKRNLGFHTTIAAPSLDASSISSTVKTSSYFTAHSSGSEPIPNIGLSPRSALPSGSEFNSNTPWDADDPELPKLSVRKHGSTSARLPPTIPAKRVISPKKRLTSPDPYDDLSFDMNVDESFFEQVGMIEQGALSASVHDKGKGKAKDIGTQGATSHGRPSAVPSRKVPPDSASGTKLLAECPVSPSSAERITRIYGSMKRATSASSSSSAESPMPPCTQPLGRRLPRDPSLIVISSEEEAPEGYGTPRPLNITRRRATKGRKMDQGKVAESDVIDISD